MHMGVALLIATFYRGAHGLLGKASGDWEIPIRLGGLLLVSALHPV